MFIACIYKDFSHFTFTSNINKNNLIFQMSMDTSIFCVTLNCLLLKKLFYLNIGKSFIKYFVLLNLLKASLNLSVSKHTFHSVYR